MTLIDVLDRVKFGLCWFIGPSYCRYVSAAAYYVDCQQCMQQDQVRLVKDSMSPYQLKALHMPVVVDFLKKMLIGLCWGF